MQKAYVVTPDFFDEAESLRTAFEQHFDQPEAHDQRHQVWNYWYVPGTYTYLRTHPDQLLPKPLVESFVTRLRLWASSTLGLNEVSYPWCSLYVDGCGQKIHNDAMAGQMGYVYSLTRWDERNFLGGETILYKEENYWQTTRMTSSGASTTFYDLIPSQFNQLLVFDDRVIHGVQTLEGTMNPYQGRVVMHGHMKASAVIVSGSLESEQVNATLSPIFPAIQALSDRYRPLIHGFITMQATIAPDGAITTLQPLCDRLLPITADTEAVSLFRQALVTILHTARYPSCSAPSKVTVPVVVC